MILTASMSKDLQNWTANTRRYGSAVIKIVHDEATFAMNLAERYIIQASKDHYRTGKLEKGIDKKKYKSGSTTWYSVYNSVNYAKFIEYPTKPHIIRAKRAKALRFYSPRHRKFIYRMWVLHPGYKGDPIFKRAFMRYFFGLNRRINSKITAKTKYGGL